MTQDLATPGHGTAGAPAARTRQRTTPRRPRGGRWGPVALAAAAVLLVALGVLAAQPLLGMRADLAAQRELTGRLLERIDHQEELLARQVGLTEQLLDETVPLQRQLLETTREGVDVGREGLDIGRETLEEVREIRRRTPESPARLEDPATELAD